MYNNKIMGIQLENITMNVGESFGNSFGESVEKSFGREPFVGERGQYVEKIKRVLIFVFYHFYMGILVVWNQFTLHNMINFIIPFVGLAWIVTTVVRSSKKSKENSKEQSKEGYSYCNTVNQDISYFEDLFRREKEYNNTTDDRWMYGL